MSHLLSICIPTYKRIDFLERLLGQISIEIDSLCRQDQELITINLFENPSEDTSSKEKLVRSYEFGSALFRYSVNKSNIGGDANIQQSCLAGNHSAYNWVIGDDEQLLPGSLINIISYLRENPACGLLLLRDPAYQIHESILRINSWCNYYAFTKDVAAIQPHLLIAHTLISCNIFKSSIYSKEAGLAARTIYAARAGLPFSFCHMHGILTGLSKQDTLAVHLLLFPAINASSRAPSEISAGSINHFTWANMTRLYRHYLYWLGYEFGVDIETARSHPSMQGMFYRQVIPVRIAVINLLRALKSKLRQIL